MCVVSLIVTPVATDEEQQDYQEAYDG